jgi:predicted transcriptional regulator
MRKEKFMTIRLPEELKEKIRKEAEKNRRSMQNEILVTVERGLQVSKAK